MGKGYRRKKNVGSDTEERIMWERDNDDDRGRWEVRQKKVKEGSNTEEIGSWEVIWKKEEDGK